MAAAVCLWAKRHALGRERRRLPSEQTERERERVRDEGWEGEREGNKCVRESVCKCVCVCKCVSVCSHLVQPQHQKN